MGQLPPAAARPAAAPPTTARRLVSAFTDLSAFAAVPRLAGIRLSPDGTWLAATVQTVAGEPGKYVSSIWRVETARADARPARLTRSAEGESGPQFLPDGGLLFTSARPAPPAAAPAPGGEDGTERGGESGKEEEAGA